MKETMTARVNGKAEVSRDEEAKDLGDLGVVAEAGLDAGVASNETL